MARLSRDERVRYGRHLLLPEISIEGQERIRGASVLVLGAGGLGSPVALYLAAAGVGRIGLLDDDLVHLSNLQRQVLYGTADVGSPKVERGAMRLRDLNPGVRVEPIHLRFDASRAVALMAEFDLVVDASDNFQTRYLLADASAHTGRPVVYGAVHRFEGQVAVFGLPGGPCYRCLFPEPPPPQLAPTCGEAGVLGAATGVIGSLQAVEAIKVLLGRARAGSLLVADLLSGAFDRIDVPPDPACRACGLEGPPPELADHDAFCGVGMPTDVPSVTATQLAAELASPEPPVLLDVRRSHEASLATLGGRQIAEADLPFRLSELQDLRASAIVAYCRAGVRSARAVTWLQGAGFTRVRHLEGGLGAWVLEVDPEFPIY